MTLCLLIIGIMPALNVYATGQLISAFEGLSSENSVLFIVSIWGVSMLLPALLIPLVNYLQSHINQLVTNKIITQIIKKNASFNGLQVYDNVDIQDTVSVLKSQSKRRPTNFLVNLVSLIREAITVFSLSYILFSIKWWIPFVILGVFIPLAYTKL